jgi:trehalose 6-phosphate phosphatase
LEHLLAAWPRVFVQLQRARRVMLLTDYDGTLTPIVERPEMATIPDSVRGSLRALAGRQHLTVGVVSGRSLADLKNKVRIDGLVYGGNHGLEIEGPGVAFLSPVAEELRPVLRVLHHVLSRALGTVKGVFVEDKGLSISVHYRQVDHYRTEDVRDIVRKIVSVAEANGKTRMTSGKKVYEIRPAVNWDKGKAIRLLMKRYGRGGLRSGLVPLFMGDDLTDEDGFRVVEAYGNGISIFVGEPSRQSAARYYLRTPGEVGSFLEMLTDCADELCRAVATEDAPGTGPLRCRIQGMADA